MVLVLVALGWDNYKLRWRFVYSAAIWSCYSVT